jgi:hypothetical protein
MHPWLIAWGGAARVASAYGLLPWFRLVMMRIIIIAKGNKQVLATVLVLFAVAIVSRGQSVSANAEVSRNDAYDHGLHSAHQAPFHF